MNNIWNERYAKKVFVYGIEPNQFYKEQLAKLSIGKILFAAEGEGRNAVYAAQQGFEVSAFDSSIEGKNKAEALALEKNVKISYTVLGLEDVDFPENYFDILVLVYAHFPYEIRKKYHQKLVSFLKPNGSIIFEAFGKEQLNYTSGGPKQLDMLFSEDEIKSEFLGLNFNYLETVEITLDEGPYHQGKGNVVRCIGQKSIDQK
jgi:2-polyprenyl-3-methyl-5-hydroxy-6-metoxy-1,4-benzoquinol methylase